MKFIATDIPGVIVIEPQVFRDERGFFLETYHQREYHEGGIDAVFVQDNHSRSQRGAIRGLHAQIRRPQAKLIRVIEGEVYDVAVDIRRGSPHFGRWTAALLSAENKRHFWIPEGFAHGFAVLSERAVFTYLCTDLYDHAADANIRWNDGDIGVDWPVRDPALSDKDRQAPFLAEIAPERLPIYP